MQIDPDEEDWVTLPDHLVWLAAIDKIPQAVAEAERRGLYDPA